MARRADKGPTLAQQAYQLGRLPLARRSTAKAGRLRWEGQLQPTPRSECYLVRIDYAPPGTPDILVLSPQLERPEAGVLPHVYDGDRLCLYYPGEWHSRMRIDTTILPWISEWLLFYELWLFTGRGLGGGHGTPAPPKAPEPAGSLRAAA
jgi:hypothetical protein